MRRASFWACIAILAAALAVPVIAAAEPPPEQLTKADAARHFDLGMRTFARGDFARAADEFELAYHTLPHADALWNAARSRDRAGQAPRAATLYAKYLRDVRDQTTERGEANARLLVLAQKLAQVNVQGDHLRAISVDDQPMEEGIFYVIPGAHVLRATLASNESQQRTVEVRAGDAVSVVFEPAPTAQPRKPPADAPSAEPVGANGAPAKPAAQDHGQRSWSPRPWLLLVLAGATAVATGLTIASGVDTLSALHRYDAGPTTGNLADGEARQTRTNVGIGVSAGLGALTLAGTIWWASLRPSGTPVSQALRGATLVSLGVAPGGLSGRWRF
jgi:hypothetical protein